MLQEFAVDPRVIIGRVRVGYNSVNTSLPTCSDSVVVGKSLRNSTGTAAHKIMRSALRNVELSRENTSLYVSIGAKSKPMGVFFHPGSYALHLCNSASYGMVLFTVFRKTDLLRPTRETMGDEFAS